MRLILLSLFKKVRGKSKKFYYAISSVSIFIIAIIINMSLTGMENLVKKLLEEENRIFCLLRDLYHASKGAINPYNIIFSLIIVAFFTSRIVGLNMPNKKERAIWRTYQMANRAITNFELVFNIINPIRDETYIMGKIKDVKEVIEPKSIEILTAIGVKNKYGKQELFVKTLTDIKNETEFIMMAYKEYISDNFYKNISQLNTDVSLYEFNSNQSFNTYNIENLLQYVSEIIKQMDDLCEEWYKFYKPEISFYNKQNNFKQCLKLKRSIKAKRIEKGMLIEEIIYNIGEFSVSDEKIKKEILYRLIEDEKVYPNEEDAKKIAEVLKIDLQKFFKRI